MSRDPNAPRSTRNFNPFETFKGNSPDASGIYPGEVKCILTLFILLFFVLMTLSSDFMSFNNSVTLQGSHSW